MMTIKTGSKGIHLGLIFTFILAVLSTTLQVGNVSAASGEFPKMASADTVYVYDVRNDSAEAKLAALALQGLINQSSARIYVLTRDADLDQLWLNESGKSYATVPLVTGSNPGFRTMYRDYQDSVNNLIVWDGSQEWTFNIALMKGSLEGGLPVTNSLKNAILSEFGSKTVEDLRNNWSGRVEAYDWALDNLMPSLNKQILFSAGLRTTEPNPESNWTGHPWTIFDYAVASKSFAFYLDPRIPAEKDEIVKIIQTGGYSPGTPVMGYSPDGDDLNATTNPYGVGYVVSDYFSNGSVWSSFGNKTYSQPPGQAVDAQPGKVYVAITTSDGDNLQYDQQLISHFQNPTAGQVPVGISIAPVLQEVGSPLLDYLYSKAGSNIELVAGPSGYQFIYPENYSSSGYDAWLARNKQWLTDAGVHTSNIWHIPANSESHNKMADSLVGSGVTGLLRGDDASRINAYHGMYTVPQGDMIFQYGDIYRILSNVSIDATQPVFHNIYPVLAYYGVDADGKALFFDRLKEEVDRLNRDFPGKFVFLKPQDEVATINKLNTNLRGVSFDADNSDKETIHLYEDHFSAMDNGHRFADGTSSWIYKFDLAEDVNKATLTMDIGGDYVVDISKDGVNWSPAARANGSLNRTIDGSDLSGWLTDNPSKTIYVRFSDGSPQDGNGPSLYHLTISTEISQLDLLAPSYLENQFIIQNSGSIDNDHRYADEFRSIVYKFDLKDDIDHATLTMDIGGNYVVDISNDGVSWSPAASANGGLSRRIDSSDLSGWLVNNPSKTVFVRFTDGTPQDGNGPSIYRLIIASETPDNMAPVTTDNAPSGWINHDCTVNLSASDSGSGVAATYYSVDGGARQTGTSVKLTTDGVHTLTYWSVDRAGNTESKHTVTVKIDKTPPSLSVQLDNTSIWPANHKMVRVHASLNASDAGSGVASVKLISITSNEPDSGLGDIQAELGTAADSFNLRAERSGAGTGRIYTITYQAADKAGNSAVSSVTVTVPHDQSAWRA
ncbi:OmpL47-type beta-barrel domain-containing protein [Cohnella soli]|uniref:OmpL47-type beta-barrel domain-containing protein n=1 Tax=Cohnella soli TaxID=425005 RepID=A0ABW0HLR6_9BACL